MPSDKLGSLPDIPRWLVWLFALYCSFYQLGGYAVLNNNEGLYAEIAREMLHGNSWHDWVIPHLNGLAYMEKPPLLYWLTAASFFIFGEHEWSVRLVPTLASLGCVALIMRFGRACGRDRAGKLAAVMFTSGLGVMVMGRTLMFDMLLTVFLVAAVMNAYLFLERRQRRYYYRTMALLALALLAKGFVALILFAAIIGMYSLLSAGSVRGFLQNLAVWFDWRGLLLFLLIAAPWHIAASMAEPIFAWFYFINEHILRFLGKREPHDYYSGSWWYYLPRMLVFLFPWSMLLPLLLLWRRGRVRTGAQLLMLLGWCMPLVFFSVSSAKANYYLIATIPLAALQLAFLIEDLAPHGRALLSLPALIFTALCGFLLYKLGLQQQAILETLSVVGLTLRQFLQVGFGLGILFGLLSAGLAWWSRRCAVYALLILPMITLPFLLELVKLSNPYTSTRDVVSFLAAQPEQKELFLYKVFEQQSSLPFYLKRPVRIIDSRSNDLFWGNKLHSNRIVIDDAQFSSIFTDVPVWVLVSRADLPEFQQLPYAEQFKLVRQIGDSLIFSN